jgi:hypothetical protein
MLRFDPDHVYCVRIRSLTEPNAKSNDRSIKGQAVQALMSDPKVLVTVLPGGAVALKEKPAVQPSNPSPAAPAQPIPANNESKLASAIAAAARVLAG